MPKRKIIKIDEAKCNGCGACIPNCPEGALKVIDGKVRLISDLFCDGLGACLGHCPEGAITIEERVAEKYEEKKVMENIIKQGKSTIIAHLEHLKNHNETGLLNEALEVLREKRIENPINPDFTRLQNSQAKSAPEKCKAFPGLKSSQFFELQRAEGQGRGNPEQISDEKNGIKEKGDHMHSHSGCPGSKAIDFRSGVPAADSSKSSKKPQSELRQWPVQLHLVSPDAPYYRGADVVLSADCVAYSLGNFHSEYLKGKSLAIACPKLDEGLDTYKEKIISLIEDAKINTLTVMTMQVPCCSGLLNLAKVALSGSKKKVPLKSIVVSLQGDILEEAWV